MVHAVQKTSIWITKGDKHAADARELRLAEKFLGGRILPALIIGLAFLAAATGVVRSQVLAADRRRTLRPGPPIAAAAAPIRAVDARVVAMVIAPVHAGITSTVL